MKEDMPALPSPMPMNMDTNSNEADAKSLKEENLKLKEQRMCKVRIFFSNLNRSSKP